MSTKSTNKQALREQVKHRETVINRDAQCHHCGWKGSSTVLVVMQIYKYLQLTFWPYMSHVVTVISAECLNAPQCFVL